MTREQLEADIRYNEMELEKYRQATEATPAGSRMAEILSDYYAGEVKRLKARLAEWQQEAQTTWE